MQSRLGIKNLFVDKCCVCLCFGFIAVHRALQGVDDMVVGVVLVVVQNTVICVVLWPAQCTETDTINVRLDDS